MSSCHSVPPNELVRVANTVVLQSKASVHLVRQDIGNQKLASILTVATAGYAVGLFASSFLSNFYLFITTPCRGPQSGFHASKQSFGAHGFLPISVQTITSQKSRQPASGRATTTIMLRSFTVDPKRLTEELNQANSALKVLRMLEQEINNPIFNDIHAAAAFRSLARFRSKLTPAAKARPILRTLARRFKRLMESRDVGSGPCAKVFWSITALRSDVPEFKSILPQLIQTAKLTVVDMGPPELVNILWACATLSLDDAQLDDLLQVLMERILDVASSLTAKQIVQAIWAITCLRWLAPESKEGLTVLATLAEIRLEEFKIQDISSIVWCAGILKHEAYELFELLPTLSKRAINFMGSMKSQQLRNICVGLALADVTDHAFMGAAAQRMVELLPKLQGKDRKDLILSASMTLWAFAKLGICKHELLQTVEDVAPKVLRRMSNWDVCALGWSYGRLSAEGTYSEIKSRISQELSHRGLSDADVDKSSLGSPSW